MRRYPGLPLPALLAILLIRPAAAQWNGEFPVQPPPPETAYAEPAPEPPAPRQRPRSDRFTDTQLARIQMISGPGGGLTFALGAGVATYFVTGCLDGKGELPGCAIAEDAMPFVLLGGYLLGNAFAVHQTGWYEGRQGSYAATLAGTVVGFGLGALAVGVGPLEEAPLPVALAVFLGVSQAFPVGFYHWSDRIHVDARWTAPDGFDPKAPTLASLAQGLRPGLKVDLLRL